MPKENPSKPSFFSTPLFGFFIRVLLIYGVVYLTAGLLSSDWMTEISGRNYIAPAGFNTSPVQWLGLLLFLFVLLERKNIKKEDLRWPTNLEFSWAIFTGTAAFFLGLFLTHPPHKYHPAIGEFITNHQPYAGPVIGSVVCTGLILTFLPATLLFFPTQISRLRWYFIYLIVEGLIFMSVLESIYHLTFNPLLTRTSAWFTDLVAKEVQFDLTSNFLSADGFSVYIGPSCSGIGSLILFLFLFSYVTWSLLRAKNPINKGRAAVAFIGGIICIFLLNAFRIASIMVVGIKQPDFAIGLFHSSWGGILFFLFFLVLLPVIKNWVFVSKDDKKTKTNLKK